MSQHKIAVQYYFTVHHTLFDARDLAAENIHVSINGGDEIIYIGKLFFYRIEDHMFDSNVTLELVAIVEADDETAAREILSSNIAPDVHHTYAKNITLDDEYYKIIY